MRTIQEQIAIEIANIPNEISTQATNIRRFRIRNKYHGLCKECTNPAIDGKRCEKHIRMDAEKASRWKAKRKKMGLCIDCGKEKVTGGGRCERCRMKNAQSKYERRRINENY